MPSVAWPSSSETTPVGVGVPEVPLTVTVNVTDSPTGDGSAEDVTAVLVGGLVRRDLGYLAGPGADVPRSATNTSPALSTATSTG